MAEKISVGRNTRLWGFQVCLWVVLIGFSSNQLLAQTNCAVDLTTPVTNQGNAISSVAAITSSGVPFTITRINGSGNPITFRTAGADPTLPVYMTTNQSTDWLSGGTNPIYTSVPEYLRFDVRDFAVNGAEQPYRLQITFNQAVTNPVINISGTSNVNIVANVSATLLSSHLYLNGSQGGNGGTLPMPTATAITNGVSLTGAHGSDAFNVALRLEGSVTTAIIELTQLADISTWTNSGGLSIWSQIDNMGFTVSSACCAAGTTAPFVSAITLSNTCPVTTVNLNSLVTSTTPSGARLRWHTVATNPTTLDSVATPSVLATAGTYYAYYFDAANNCYSPATAAVTVTINTCSVVSCTGTTIGSATIAPTTGVVADNYIVNSQFSIQSLSAGGGYTDASIGYRLGTPTATTDRNYKLVFSSPVKNVVLHLGFINNDILFNSPNPAGEETISNITAVGASSAVYTFQDFSTSGMQNLWNPTTRTISSSVNSFGPNSNSKIQISSTTPFTEITLTHDYITGSNPFGVLLQNVCYELACNAGTTAPSVSAITLSNTCPATTVNLNSLHTGTIPSGARLRWHTVAINPTAADSVAAPSVLATAGTYYAYYFDATNNCYSPATAAVTVTINTPPSAPTASVTTQPTCATATASVSLSGLPSTGTWTLTRLNTVTSASVVITNIGSGATFSYGGVPSGTYTYTVKNNATNCESTASNSITVNAQPATPTISSVAKTDPSVSSCPAANDGTITVTATGANLQYSKDNGLTWQASNQFTGVVAGSYTIKVKDNVSTCEVVYTSNPVVLTAPTCPSCATPSVGGTATYSGGTICSSSNMGTINLTGQTGGVVTWQISTNSGGTWTAIAGTTLKTSYNFINATNGQQYRAVVNTGGSCSDAYSTVVTLVTSATACTTTTCSYNSSSFSPTISTSSNPSYTTHVILVNPTTGVMDYVTTANSTAFTGVALGDYIMYAVTYDNTVLPVPTIVAGANITGLAGCTSISDALLTKVCCPTIVAPTVSMTQPSCGVTTGTITVTAPTSGVTYSFDNGATFQTSNIKSGLAAATTYQVLTKDNGNACLSATTPSVIDPILGVPTAPTVTLTQPTCSVSTGTITVTAPTSGVTYSFDNGINYQASATSGALLAGRYDVIVKDNTTACVSAITVVNINLQPATPAAPTTTVVQPTCTVTTGTITVTAPTSGVTYSFDNGTTYQATATSSALPSGTYQVVVKDNVSNCVSTATASLINPILAVPTAPTVSETQPTCGTTTGTITVNTPSTGVTYSFDNGTTYQASHIKSGLAAATTYQIVVKDNTSLCASAATPSVINAILAVPNAPTTSVIQPTCSVTTGTMTITAPSSGVTYSFDNGSTYQASNVKSGLAAGAYQIVVKDDVSNCVSTATSAIINNPLAVPTAPTLVTTQPTCSTTTGTIGVLTPSTGVTYSFDNGTTYQASQSLSGLASGTYQIVVKDNTSACVSTSTATTITAPLTVPAAPATAVTQPTCAVATGTITVTAPTSGVTYSFDNGATYQAAATSNALVSGTYQVLVKDNTSLCASAATPSLINAALAVPTAPTVSVTQPTCAVTTGTISVTAPLSGVTYSFDNGISYQLFATSNALTSGTYPVFIKNTASGCVSPSTSATINAALAVPSAPTTTVAQPICGATTGTITVTNPTTGVTYSFDNGTTYQAAATSNALTSGTYSVKIKDNSSNCVSTATPSVINAILAVPSAPTATAVHPTCTIATGSITITSPSTGVTYSFTNGTSFQATATTNTLASGIYQLMVKDNVSGCTSAATPITINAQPATPAAPTVNITQPTCFVFTGDLTITQPTGAGMTYSIDGTTYTNTTGVFNNVAPATYSVTAKSSDGCISASSTSATVVPVVPAPTVNITQPSCVTPKGLFTILAPVGAGFTYSIDGVDYSNTTGLFSNLDVGTYYVTAKSGSGCISPQTTAVVNPPVPTPVIAISQPNCTVGTGTITITTPSTGVTYSFDNGATFQTSNFKNGLLGGTYSIVIKNDIGGCTTLAKQVVVNNRPTTGCNCDNTTGNISFTVSNQNNTAAYTQQYVLTMNDGLMLAFSNTPSFTGLASGQYAVYALNYETTSGITGLSIGQNISTVSGACMNTSVPLFYHVCIPSYSCNNSTGDITATISSQNNTTTYTQKYALTDETGKILLLSNNPTFVGLTNGKYQMFAINYETASGVTGLTINSNILAVAGLCFNLSTPLYYQVCTPPSVYTCNNATGTVTATISNHNASGTYTQQYALTRDDNTILQVANAPTFTGLMDGQYKLYAINHETASGLTGLTVGQNLSGLAGACFNKSTPLLYQVCLPVFNCNNNTGNITATISGQNTGATFTQQYVLTDSLEKILRIATTPTFTGLPNGRYKLFGINYETAGGITNLTVGQTMSTVTGSCVSKSAALLYQVCIVPEICNNRIDDDGDGLIDCEDVTDCPSCGCDNTTGNITFTNTGQTTTGYTQVYALTDSTGKILNTSITAAFNGLASGRYRVYAINYETTGGITGLTIGQSINGVTGSCINKSLPLLFKVCVCVTFNFKALLEGPYQTSTQTMHTILNQRGLLPGQTPMGQFSVQTPQGQPYKGLPWNYAGTEGDTITTYPATVVDWVLVSLRLDSTTNANAFRVTGWLHNDGHISFISPCFDLANGAYFVVIEHRNHIGVMSPQKVLVQNGTMVQDFTLNDGYIFTNPPSFGQKAKGSKWVLFAGDGKKDDPNTNYDVNFNDSKLWKSESGIFDQYKQGDFDMNADVNFLDNYLWKSNSGKYSRVPH